MNTAERPITDADLRPYGFRPNTCGCEAWCVTCGRTFMGDPLDPAGQKPAAPAFKCRTCAADQFRIVEKQIEACDADGKLPYNPVPPEFATT